MELVNGVFVMGLFEIRSLVLTIFNQGLLKIVNIIFLALREGPTDLVLILRNSFCFESSECNFRFIEV